MQCYHGNTVERFVIILSTHHLSCVLIVFTNFGFDTINYVKVITEIVYFLYFLLPQGGAVLKMYVFFTDFFSHGQSSTLGNVGWDVTFYRKVIRVLLPVAKN